MCWVFFPYDHCLLRKSPSSVSFLTRTVFHSLSVNYMKYLTSMYIERINKIDSVTVLLKYSCWVVCILQFVVSVSFCYSLGSSF